MAALLADIQPGDEIILPSFTFASTANAFVLRGGVPVFVYVPLHSAPAGRKYGRSHGPLPHIDAASDRLVRLPLWAGLTDEDTEAVIAAVKRCLAS